MKHEIIITYLPHESAQEERAVLPWGKNYDYKRTEGAVTIVVGGVLHTDIRAEFDLNADGSISFREVSGRGSKDDRYAHVFQMPNGCKPTEAQIARCARAFLGIERFFGSSPGNSLNKWAFAGMKSPDELSKKYGTGKKVYLA